MDMLSPGASATKLARTRTLALIGAATGIGCAHPTAAQAPAWLRDHDLIDHLAAQGVSADWSAVIGPCTDAMPDPVTAIAHASRLLATAVAGAVTEDTTFTVLGGDHSCAIGTWSGVAKTIRSRGALGLLWVDAHMDAHVPETSPSGFYHGMPLACLLGYGAKSLISVTDPQPAILPEHVAIVGIRSFEPEEAALLQRLGVRVFDMAEISVRGLAAVMEEASDIVRRGTVATGISIDLDALDPTEVSAVGSPEPGGLSVAELSAALTEFAIDPGVVGCEIVEFNPTLGHACQTARAIEQLIVAFQGRRQ